MTDLHDHDLDDSDIRGGLDRIAAAVPVRLRTWQPPAPARAPRVRTGFLVASTAVLAVLLVAGIVLTRRTNDERRLLTDPSASSTTSPARGFRLVPNPATTVLPGGPLDLGGPATDSRGATRLRAGLVTRALGALSVGSASTRSSDGSTGLNGNGRAYVVASDAGFVRVSDEPVDDIAVSPDGRTALIVRPAGGGTDLEVVDLPTATRRTVLHREADVITARFGSDGHHVGLTEAMDSSDDAPGRVAVIDLDAPDGGRTYEDANASLSRQVRRGAGAQWSDDLRRVAVPGIEAGVLYDLEAGRATGLLARCNFAAFTDTGYVCLVMLDDAEPRTPQTAAETTTTTNAGASPDRWKLVHVLDAGGADPGTVLPSGLGPAGSNAPGASPAFNVLTSQSSLSAGGAFRTSVALDDGRVVSSYRSPRSGIPYVLGWQGESLLIATEDPGAFTIRALAPDAAPGPAIVRLPFRDEGFTFGSWQQAAWSRTP